MIIYKDKNFATNSDYPDTDFLGNADYVIPDKSELAERIIKLYPKYILIIKKDENGEEIITDVIEDTSYSEQEVQNILSVKISEIKKSCEKAIISGTGADVLGRGMLHYSLTETKQDDIKVLMQNIQNGAEGVLWHDDSRVMHEFYTAEQFTALYQTLFAYIITCKITSDGLEQYAIDLANTKDIETLESITWGTTLPEYIQTQIDEQITMMLGG